MRFDESHRTEQAVAPLRYFRQRPDYTNLVFAFMNAVAVEVFDTAGLWQTPSGKPRYVTALAYFWTEQSPAITQHPRVMPVLTSDRAQWHDPAYRAEDRALIQRWAESGAERLATWDYYFGAPYPYPRQFNQWIDESLKYLHAQGVDVFSQLPASWGLDGPKAWLAAQLLWDPGQSAEVLLDEFYTHFFGPRGSRCGHFMNGPKHSVMSVRGPRIGSNFIWMKRGWNGCCRFWVIYGIVSSTHEHGPMAARVTPRGFRWWLKPLNLPSATRRIIPRGVACWRLA